MPRWISLALIAMQCTQIVLIIELVYTLSCNMQILLRLLKLWQVSQLRHIVQSFEASHHRMITLPFIRYQLCHVFQEAWHQVPRHCRWVLHRGTFIDLEKPEFAFSIREQIEAVDADSTLAPLDFVPSRQDRLYDNLFNLRQVLLVPNLFTCWKVVSVIGWLLRFKAVWIAGFVGGLWGVGVIMVRRICGCWLLLLWDGCCCDVCCGFICLCHTLNRLGLTGSLRPQCLLLGGLREIVLQSLSRLTAFLSCLVLFAA